MKSCIIFFLLCVCIQLGAQQIEDQIKQKQSELNALSEQVKLVKNEIGDLKLIKVINDLKQIGLPSEDYIEHSGMILSYNQDHKQANWVSHIILPDVITGNISRTNDFRIDAKIVNGTAVEEDYFLTNKDVNGNLVYDGFGYDRGHLAPSADFRWSEKALSESYLYSNISPQNELFNRESWRTLEDAIRSYIYRNNNTQLYVVTAPLLTEDLPKIPRSKYNEISVPQYFVKAVLDVDNKRGIGFIMENKALSNDLSQYAVSIDSIESLLGFDLYSGLDDKLELYVESQVNAEEWLPENKQVAFEPIAAQILNKGEYNSTMAKQGRLSGKKAKVCGKFVSHRKSRKGNYWANFDAPYPNAPFSFWIRKENLLNFDMLPHLMYQDQNVCVEGNIKNYGSNVSIEIMRDIDIYKFKPKQ